MSTKKRSFFERLAGNLRFDDDEDDIDAPPSKQEVRRAHVTVSSHEKHREVPVRSGNVEVPPDAEEIAHLDDEVGELPVDVYETPSEIIIQTLIAGVLPEHLSINITRDVVTISGRREESRNISDDSYHIRELYWGSFGRTVHLPAEVEIDNAEAIERHGMLMIKLPKIDKGRKTTLKIKSI